MPSSPGRNAAAPSLWGLQLRGEGPRAGFGEGDLGLLESKRTAAAFWGQGGAGQSCAGVTSGLGDTVEAAGDRQQPRGLRCSLPATAPRVLPLQELNPGLAFPAPFSLSLTFPPSCFSRALEHGERRLLCFSTWNKNHPGAKGFAAGVCSSTSVPQPGREGCPGPEMGRVWSGSETAAIWKLLGKGKMFRGDPGMPRASSRGAGLGLPGLLQAQQDVPRASSLTGRSSEVNPGLSGSL